MRSPAHWSTTIRTRIRGTDPRSDQDPTSRCTGLAHPRMSPFDVSVRRNRQQRHEILQGVGRIRWDGYPHHASMASVALVSPGGSVALDAEIHVLRLDPKATLGEPLLSTTRAVAVGRAHVRDLLAPPRGRLPRPPARERTSRFCREGHPDLRPGVVPGHLPLECTFPTGSENLRSNERSEDTPKPARRAHENSANAPTERATAPG